MFGLYNFFEANAINQPDKTAIVYAGERLSYSQLQKRVNSLADSLSKLGCKSGDKVAFMFRNGEEFVEIFYAVQKLGAEGPQILIIHTHGTEAYLPAAGEEYTPSDPFRTTDPGRSVIRVGDVLCSVLEEYGLRVLHDRTLYDYPSYAGSYERAAASIEAYLAEYPDIALVLDVHRDAIGDESTVYKTCAAGSGMAQVMLVCGTDEYLEHPLWRENLKLALAMQAAAVSANGALMRPIHLAPERYNQQYTTGSLIIEVGTNGNTLSEALAAAELFGRAAGEMLASLAAPG